MAVTARGCCLQGLGAEEDRAGDRCLVRRAVRESPARPSRDVAPADQPTRSGDAHVRSMRESTGK